MSLYVLNRDRLSVPFLRHTTAKSTGNVADHCPPLAGVQGGGKGPRKQCKELTLVIEVDGITHLDDETGEKDKQKSRALESAGFTIIRFTDEDVLENMSGVIQRIEKMVDAIGLSSPPPAPPPAGDV